MFSSQSRDGTSVRQLNGGSETAVVSAVSEFLQHPAIDPWQRFSALRNDCILLIEFSEVEGPKAILSMPEKLDAHFDVNEFAIRAMTSDYQSSNKSHFQLRNDMHMFLTNTEQGVHTYVQYFTLFDIEARGYVRPYCIAYVSPNKHKMLKLFDKLRAQCSALLNEVKTCNRRLFLKELREAADILECLENRAVSSYYEICYDKTTSSSYRSSSSPDVPCKDILKVRYMRLHRELDYAILQIQDWLQSYSNCCQTHEVRIEAWQESIVAGYRSDRAPCLKSLEQLCPCIYKNFESGLRSILKRFHAWSEVSSFGPMCHEAFGSDCVDELAAFIESAPVLAVRCAGDAAKTSLNFKSDSENKKRLENGSVTEAAGVVADEQLDSNIQNNSQKCLLVSVMPSLPHLLYPLLVGKFVLVCANEARRHTVMGVVLKLKEFVPSRSGPRDGEYFLWHRGDIPAALFGDCKILGQHLERGGNVASLVPQNFKSFLSLVDLNTNVLHACKYRGKMLQPLTQKAGQFTNDVQLTAYVHAIMAEFALLAYILYFSIYADQDCYRRNIRFLRGLLADQLCVDNCDFRILRYFVELMKAHKIGDMEMSGLQEGLFLDEEVTKNIKL